MVRKIAAAAVAALFVPVVQAAGWEKLWTFEHGAGTSVAGQTSEILAFDSLNNELWVAGLKGVEDRCWVQLAGHERVHAIADEDLERENDEKTSAVHFVRFELTAAMVAAAKNGAAIGVGIDHPNYRHAVEPVALEIRDALVADLA